MVRTRKHPGTLNPEPGTPERGLTLMEVLVAMIVLGVAIVGIAQGFTVGLRAASTARGTTTATQLAVAKLAELDAGLVPVTQDDEGDFEDFGEPDFRWRIESRTTSWLGLYEVVVTVTWPDRGTTRDLTVVQWMLDREAGALAGLQAGSSTPIDGTSSGGTGR
jgi:prepilin-type N-terminal cleavage/methylation domain-containing protein